jgi:hypothetical protein
MRYNSKKELKIQKEDKIYENTQARIWKCEYGWKKYRAYEKGARHKAKGFYCKNAGSWL